MCGAPPAAEHPPLKERIVKRLDSSHHFGTEVCGVARGMVRAGSRTSPATKLRSPQPSYAQSTDTSASAKEPAEKAAGAAVAVACAGWRGAQPLRRLAL